MTTSLIAGSFGTGLKRIQVGVDKGVEFRELVAEISEDMGLTEEQFDEQLALLVELRAAARHGKAVALVEPRG